MKASVRRLNAAWLRYEYKHTTIALSAIILFVIFFDSALISGILEYLQHLDYVAAFIAGILMVSFITVTPAVVLLVALVQQQGLDPLAIAILAGFGSMLGDWLLLLSFKEHIFDELRPIFVKLGLQKAARRLRRRSTSWVLLLLGCLSIATPMPDEVGVGLLGISHFRTPYLLAICFVLNAVGIYLLAEGVQLVVG